MTLRHLNVFICVCDEGNMTAAAQKLHIAQPSISQAIAELEGYYNVKLFERLGRKLFLTMAGQKLATYARHILNLSKEAEEEMREINRNGVLRIGASVTVGTCILCDVIDEFMKENSHVKIVSTVNNTKIIEGMLLLDQLDVGLVEGNIQSQGMLSEPFMEDELVVVCAPTHPFADKKRVKPEELEDLEFIIREEGSGTRELFESVMNSNGIKWRTYGVYNNAETIKKTVSAGHALSVMSRLTVQKETQEKELAIVEVAEMGFHRQFSIVYHKNKYISPVFQKFIQLCRGLKKS